MKNGITKMVVAGAGGAALVGAAGYAAYASQGNAIKQTTVGKLFDKDIVSFGTLHLSQGVALAGGVALAIAWVLYRKVL